MIYEAITTAAKTNRQIYQEALERFGDTATLACDYLQAHILLCGDILEEYFGLHRPHIWKTGFHSSIPSATTGLAGLHGIHTDYTLSIIDGDRKSVV